MCSGSNNSHVCAIVGDPWKFLGVDPCAIRTEIIGKVKGPGERPQRRRRTVLDCPPTSKSTPNKEDISFSDSRIDSSDGNRPVMSLGVVALLAASIAGCAPGPRFVGEIRTTSSSQLEIARAVAHRTTGGIVIDGDVRRPDGYAGHVPGYLKIEGHDGAGTVIAATKASWGQFMSRRFRLAYFRAMLSASEPTSINTITVEAVTDPVR